MNVPVRQPVAAQRLKVVDCDIHPAYAAPTALFEFLSALARPLVHVRHLLPAGADRPAALPAHDGGRHADRLVPQERLASGR